MTRLFDERGLQVSEEWIQTPTGLYGMADVHAAWVTRRRTGRGNRWLTGGLAAGALLVLVGGASLTGWLNRYWLWLLAVPPLLLGLGSIGLLDPIAIYLEKRHHELWITTGAGDVLLWRANAVEARKALRQIQRARQRRLDARGG